MCKPTVKSESRFVSVIRSSKKMCTAHLYQAKCALLLLAFVSLYDKQAACTTERGQNNRYPTGGDVEIAELARVVVNFYTRFAGFVRKRPGVASCCSCGASIGDRTHTARSHTNNRVVCRFFLQAPANKASSDVASSAATTLYRSETALTPRARTPTIVKFADFFCKRPPTRRRPTWRPLQRRR